ncbi:hypothetical protein PRIPAC_80239 [Pristionchus pacificus]|uniref:Uncharacterized protein n=1 Tax=Pristionchus pacificus TaxID=54126 RepID=A0A2A6CPE9_PRIPA|nr:hypothetical protein PRIPAC_80239 [Pristionchus pacificus]|eukprot:PDM79978.1 hypothetical protein PRIPAC_32557 [Pristionchus pacificus]
MFSTRFILLQLAVVLGSASALYYVGNYRRDTTSAGAAAPANSGLDIGGMLKPFVDAINQFIQLVTGTFAKAMEIPRSFISGIANGAGMGGQAQSGSAPSGGAAGSGAAPSSNAAPGNSAPSGGAQ